MQIIAHILSAIAQALHYINPLLLAVVSIMWIFIYTRMRKEIGRMYMRCYVLERQIEHIVDREKIDPTFINCMRKLGEDYNR